MLTKNCIYKSKWRDMSHITLISMFGIFSDCGPSGKKTFMQKAGCRPYLYCYAPYIWYMSDFCHFLFTSIKLSIHVHVVVQPPYNSTCQNLVLVSGHINDIKALDSVLEIRSQTFCYSYRIAVPWRLNRIF